MAHPAPPVIIDDFLRNHDIANRYPILQQPSIPVPVGINDVLQIVNFAKTVDHDVTSGRRLRRAALELRLRVEQSSIAAPARPPHPPLRVFLMQFLGMPAQIIAFVVEELLLPIPRILENFRNMIRLLTEDSVQIERALRELSVRTNNREVQTVGQAMSPVPRRLDGRTHPERLASD
ncbi:hypothetical protein IAR55_005091 [Kwoniella newhampshirensis]|uniref:Uncharacterized protein n=1 Tax=Kwoniella newhampshirensis TaxID=1651941 RepID=A0AAW0YMM2_9TREE